MFKEKEINILILLRCANAVNTTVSDSWMARGYSWQETKFSVGFTNFHNPAEGELRGTNLHED